MINILSTIVVGASVTIIIALIVIKMIREKKKGKSSCGCSCANCPSSGMCHTKKPKDNSIK